MGHWWVTKAEPLSLSYLVKSGKMLGLHPQVQETADGDPVGDPGQGAARRRLGQGSSGGPSWTGSPALRQGESLWGMGEPWTLQEQRLVAGSWPCTCLFPSWRHDNGT